MLLFNEILLEGLYQPFNFNTSYVIIQLMLINIGKQPFHHFNTSYVIIQQKGHFIVLVAIEFQYILCYYSTNEKPSFLYLTDLYKSRS